MFPHRKRSNSFRSYAWALLQLLRKIDLFSGKNEAAMESFLKPGIWEKMFLHLTPSKSLNSLLSLHYSSKALGSNLFTETSLVGQEKEWSYFYLINIKKKKKQWQTQFNKIINGNKQEIKAVKIFTGMIQAENLLVDWLGNLKSHATINYGKWKSNSKNP